MIPERIIFVSRGITVLTNFRRHVTNVYRRSPSIKSSAPSSYLDLAQSEVCFADTAVLQEFSQNCETKNAIRYDEFYVYVSVHR